MHGKPARRNYSQTPLNIYWEMTQACALACRHCRATAMPGPHPDELTFQESANFLEQIPGFGEPMPQLILTGGDPLKRPDLYELIDIARDLNIGVSITPAATPALTQEVLVKLKNHGVEGLGLSLDGSSAARHDSMRGVPGTFDLTLQVMEWARDLGLPVQVNTLAAAETRDDIPAIYELLKPFGIARWSLFFLIPVGRGKILEPLTPAQAEELMAWVFKTSQDGSAPFILATTEAPSYRRVAIQKLRALGFTEEEIRQHPAARGFEIRDGHGILFVSNTGDVCPSGFLPIVAGNVRRDNVVEVYRSAPVFRALHDPSGFEGRCGSCEFHSPCGGSRARAFAATGNPLGSDPLCERQPGLAMAFVTSAVPGMAKRNP